MDFDGFLKQCSHKVLPDEYMAYLQILLENEDEVEPFPDHAKQEDFLKSDPRNKILCRIPMPPPMQALRDEEQCLCLEIQDVIRRGGTDSPEHKDLLSKVELVRSLVSDWIRAEICRRPDMFHRVRGVNVAYLIGGNWNMLVVEVEQ